MRTGPSQGSLMWTCPPAASAQRPPHFCAVWAVAVPRATKMSSECINESASNYEYDTARRFTPHMHLITHQVRCRDSLARHTHEMRAPRCY